jgi:hypothetical protein
MKKQATEAFPFGHHDDWAAIIRKYPSVFGRFA